MLGNKIQKANKKHWQNINVNIKYKMKGVAKDTLRGC
jgi:hypothetical protein